jgi:ATP-dependent Clp protease ATP-binding subunit ClpA
MLDPVLDRADEEAEELAHNWIGTEHLLLAITSVNDPTLSPLLACHRIEHDRVRDAVLELLNLEPGERP